MSSTANTPRQAVAAEIAAASLALMQAEQTGDLLAVELAENRVYRAGIAQVLTHVTHSGQRCAVLAIAGKVLTIDFNGQPLEIAAAAGLEFEAFQQPSAESVELAAAVAQQQRAQNATRVSDEVKQQLLAAAAKRLAKAQGAVAAEAPAPATDFKADVLAFVGLLQAREDAINSTFPVTFSAEFNRAFVRIVRSMGKTQRSAYGFIDAAGNLLKTASWKGPAKNYTRGSIYGANPLQGAGIYSVG